MKRKPKPRGAKQNRRQMSLFKYLNSASGKLVLNRIARVIAKNAVHHGFVAGWIARGEADE